MLRDSVSRTYHRTGDWGGREGEREREGGREGELPKYLFNMQIFINLLHIFKYTHLFYLQ
jgi:hypothetical protein